jgi:hypothetical protein
MVAQGGLVALPPSCHGVGRSQRLPALRRAGSKSLCRKLSAALRVGVREVEPVEHGPDDADYRVGLGLGKRELVGWAHGRRRWLEPADGLQVPDRPRTIQPWARQLGCLAQDFVEPADESGPVGAASASWRIGRPRPARPYTGTPGAGRCDLSGWPSHRSAPRPAPLNLSKRASITSAYRGSNSSAAHRLPVRSQAMRVEPEPAKGSSTRSLRPSCWRSPAPSREEASSSGGAARRRVG